MSDSPSDVELWEAGFLTRFQIKTWIESDYKAHFPGVQNTLRFLMSVIDTPKRPRGRPPTGFDKKAYDRERMRRIRAEARATQQPSKTNAEIKER